MYFVECASKIVHILSVIRNMNKETVCFQFTHFPCDDSKKLYFVLLWLSSQKYELTPIDWGLGHETMGCVVCLYIFLCHDKKIDSNLMERKYLGKPASMFCLLIHYIHHGAG